MPNIESSGSSSTADLLRTLGGTFDAAETAVRLNVDLNSFIANEQNTVGINSGRVVLK